MAINVRAAGYVGAGIDESETQFFFFFWTKSHNNIPNPAAAAILIIFFSLNEQI